jgi:hypothetical protein
MQNKTLSLNKLKLVSLVLAVLVAVMRVVEYKSYYNSETGILDGSYVFTIIAIGIVLIFTILLVVMTLKNKDEAEFKLEKNQPKGIMQAVSFAFMVPSIMYLFTTWSGYKNGTVYSENATDATFILPVAVATVLMMIFVLVTAFINISGLNLYEKAPILGIIPALWGLLLLLYFFVHDSTYIVKSENYYILLAAVAVLSSMLAYTRAYVFGDNGKRAKLLKATCPAAIALTLGYAISEMYFHFSGFERLKSLPFEMSILYFAVAVFELAI